MPYYDNDHADANSLNTNDRNLDSRKQAQLNDKYFQRITRKRIKFVMPLRVKSINIRLGPMNKKCYFRRLFVLERMA